jgi:hypothetical protein
VHDRERRRDVPEQRAGLPPGQLAALAQILAVEQLHRGIGRTAGEAVVEDLDDARRRELRERVVLMLELRRHQRAALVGRRAKLLERELAPAALIMSAVHGGGTAFAEQRFHAQATTRQLTGVERANLRGGKHSAC